MMRKTLLLIMVLTGVCSLDATASCVDWKLYQTIEITKNADGKPYVVNKERSEKCLIKNNRLADRLKSSHLNWVFKDLDCKNNNCRIEFHGESQQVGNALTCFGNNSNYTVCRLQVNELKEYCKKSDQTNQRQCTVSYDIKVGQQTIDPSIIIRPRPY
jgi:hypothetical protein